MFLKIVFFSYLALISAIEESQPVMDLLRERPTVPRIVGGQTLQKAEFPWMVSLQKNRQHFCGATIISYEWAVTAAHCVDKPARRNFDLVCGAHSLSSPREEQRAFPQTIIVHEKWNSSLITDDIALIKLRDKLTKTANCQTIDLPNDDLVLKPGQECVATGWGLTSADNQKVSDLPQKVSLPLLSQQDCSKSYSQQAKILKTNVCAGGGKGRGICNGDSGGPLNCLFNGTWSFVGLDSFTVPCAVKGYPSVFTKVNEYNSWIRDKISANQPKMN